MGFGCIIEKRALFDLIKGHYRMRKGVEIMESIYLRLRSFRVQWHKEARK